MKTSKFRGTVAHGGGERKRRQVALFLRLVGQASTARNRLQNVFIYAVRGGPRFPPPSTLLFVRSNSVFSHLDLFFSSSSSFLFFFFSFPLKPEPVLAGGACSYSSKVRFSGMTFATSATVLVWPNFRAQRDGMT